LNAEETKVNLFEKLVKYLENTTYEISDIKDIEPFTFTRTNNMDDWLIIENIDEVKE
jgi:hypothetical protein